MGGLTGKEYVDWLACAEKIGGWLAVQQSGSRQGCLIRRIVGFADFDECVFLEHGVYPL